MRRWEKWVEEEGPEGKKGVGGGKEGKSWETAIFSRNSRKRKYNEFKFHILKKTWEELGTVGYRWRPHQY